MKRNKLFTFLSIITLVLIFGVAATCNLCGIEIDTAPVEESIVESKETGAEETIEETDESMVEEQEETIMEEDETVLTAQMMQAERLDIIGSRSGSIRYDLDINEAVETGGIIYAGDDEEHNIYKAFLCFDISGLTGLNISNAQLEIGNIIKFGEPLDWASYLYFHAVNYGDLLETDEMYSMGGTQVFAIRVEELGESLMQTSDALVSTIQGAIDDERNWYQLSIGLGGAAVTDDDTDKDGYRFLLEGLVLQINYFG